jgi:hypothetical protein
VKAKAKAAIWFMLATTLLARVIKLSVFLKPILISFASTRTITVDLVKVTVVFGAKVEGNGRGDRQKNVNNE